ncbi:hypothetical protein PIIN_01274 [Serendipita indica DSM 11827]|uniref:Uncharacterized protein n=1 Tax=Serendipita indica (strain DSM 11827) TaxID=1109443 RepID=G4T7Z1_SERID|nr:hypothetical protein PIIN_01274 [Serendipita indica DSM 11827]
MQVGIVCPLIKPRFIPPPVLRPFSRKQLFIQTNPACKGEPWDLEFPDRVASLLRSRANHREPATTQGKCKACRDHGTPMVIETDLSFFSNSLFVSNPRSPRGPSSLHVEIQTIYE